MMMHIAARSFSKSHAKTSKSTKRINKLLSKPSKNPIMTENPHLSILEHSSSLDQSHSLIKTHRNFSISGCRKEILETRVRFGLARFKIEEALVSKEAWRAYDAVRVELDKFQGYLERLEEEEKLGSPESRIEELKHEAEKLGSPASWRGWIEKREAKREEEAVNETVPLTWKTALEKREAEKKRLVEKEDQVLLKETASPRSMDFEELKREAEKYRWIDPRASEKHEAEKKRLVEEEDQVVLKETASPRWMDFEEFKRELKKYPQKIASRGF